MYLVVPAKNEAHRITNTLKDYLEYFSDWRVVVVISNCSDNTEEVVKKLQQIYVDRLDYIIGDSIDGNSKGRAIKEGFKYIIDNYSTDWMGFVDADNSIKPMEMEKLWQSRDNFDAVISSRYLPQSDLQDRDSTLRNLAGFVFRKFVKILFNLPVVDTQCGAKIYKLEIIKKILSDLKVDDMAFDVEILYLLKKNKQSIKEVPITWIENTASTISQSKWTFFKTSLEMFSSILILRFKQLFKI